MILSIVVPVYNMADYLQLCADSIYANDLTDCEVIFVDDGSTDNVSPALCDQVAEGHENVRVIHQKNGGLGAARNTGLEAAKGDYLFFVDSDDTVAKDAVAVLKNAIAKFHADIYSFPIFTHDGEHPAQRLETSPIYDKPFKLCQKPEFLNALPAAWARAWRRSLFMDSGIRFPGRVWYEDIRTSAKLFAKADSIVTLDQPLYYYLARTGSIMRSSNVDRCREIMDAFDDLLNWFGKEGLLEQYRDRLTLLAVDHIFIAASVRVARANTKHPLLKELRVYMDEHFPDYNSNPHLSTLPRMSRICYRLLRGKHYRTLQTLFSLKEKLGK